MKDIQFLIKEVVGVDDLFAYEKFSTLSTDIIDAVLTEAVKFADNELLPLNKTGDIEGCKIKDGNVVTPDGFKQAYARFIENGWNSIPFAPEPGGQGLPWLLYAACFEMFSGSNMAFALCPLLTTGAVELLSKHGSDEQKRAYLPALISGKWTGTMCLTEPQAGSDVGAIATKAKKSGQHYLITGQKIYITYGEHDFTDNIIHMVLARVDGAPAGTKGISLFVVPKFLSDGSRNDVKAISIEKKLGIHASPTAVLQFGDNEGAVGYIVGEENYGLKYMFTMMNNARLAVGVQGIGIAENSYQQALAYAKERKQMGQAIITYPDVQRMLTQMRVGITAMRAAALYTAKAGDISCCDADKEKRERYTALVSLLTPVVKASATDFGHEAATLAIQIFGGIGYIEETGIAQNLRDGKITSIYEGTNGIQAIDLVKRKIINKSAIAILMQEIEEISNILRGKDCLFCKEYAEKLTKLAKHFSNITDVLLKAEEQKQLFLAYPYMQLFSILFGGFIFARVIKAALEASEVDSSDKEFYEEKLADAKFYMLFNLGYAYAIDFAAIVDTIPFLDEYEGF